MPPLDSIKTIGNIFIKIDKVLDEIKPDAFDAGDTNSCLCVLLQKENTSFHMGWRRCLMRRI